MGILHEYFMKNNLLQAESALFVYSWVSMIFLDGQIKADEIYFHFFPTILNVLYFFITVIMKRILMGSIKEIFLSNCFDKVDRR